ncbi:MAG: hypothetical protein AAGF12_39055 [Myxococcota bacterium]
MLNAPAIPYQERTTQFVDRNRPRRGTYRTPVKGYRQDEQGLFGITVDCAGDGCAAPAVDLAVQFAEISSEAYYISEGDELPIFVQATPEDADSELTVVTVGSPRAWSSARPPPATSPASWLGWSGPDCGSP